MDTAWPFWYCGNALNQASGDDGGAGPGFHGIFMPIHADAPPVAEARPYIAITDFALVAAAVAERQSLQHTYIPAPRKLFVLH